MSISPGPGPNALYGVGGMAAPPSSASNMMVPTGAPIGAPTGAPATSGPGSFAVRLNGRVNWYAGVVGTSADHVDDAKLDNLEFQGYLRLYPGFDAVASNGLQYGVVSEIRHPGSTDTATGVSASANAAENTLYWRRAYGYIGMPDLGQVHFGQGDGAFDLLMVGTFENFNDGGWNGDVYYFAPGATDLNEAWAWPDVGNHYTINRIVYLSPSWSGFRFGASFAPNDNALINTENCTVAGPGCNRLSASPLATTGSVTGAPRYRNEVDVAAEYTHAFGPGGVADALAFIAGAEYAAGPFVVGASYFRYKDQGDYQSPATEGVETNQGIAAGATYAIAPGLGLYLSYLYGQRHQLGYDYITGLPGTAFNNVKSQIFAIGTVVKW
jgi:predicted porin